MITRMNTPATSIATNTTETKMLFQVTRQGNVSDFYVSAHAFRPPLHRDFGGRKTQHSHKWVDKLSGPVL